MNEKLLDGLDAFITLMREMQHDGSISEDLAEDSVCMESFASRMLDKMLTAELDAFRLTAGVIPQGSPETGATRPH